MNQWLKKYEEELCRISDAVWETPEPGFCEFKSSAVQVEYLKAQGFEVEENVADTITGYAATWGSGKPVIAFLGEFDALYGMNQKADCPQYAPMDLDGMGQGCGHHLLGAGAIGAGLAFRDWLKENGYSGTVKIFGCPAEESGSGKAYMARDGVFADCDAALTWHPSNFHMICTGGSQSCIQCYFRFKGVSSHAAGAPHLGRSALDAVELMNVGVNYLREHMEDSDRVHYAITNSGGKSPNVVQAEAEVKYLVRSTTNPKCKKLYDRVVKIAQGAALMTETELEVIFDEGLSNTVPNFVLEDAIAESFAEAGAPVYTVEERAYAKQFKDSFPIEGQLSDLPYAVKDIEKLKENVRTSEICDYVVEAFHSDRCEMGSTDVGDVSWVVPTATVNTACYSYGAGSHSWQWTAQGKSAIAHKGMLYAAEIMARAAAKLVEEPERIEKAKAEFMQRLDGEVYQCPIPADVKPHVL